MGNQSKRALLFPARPSLGRNVLWIASVTLIYFVMARLSPPLVFEPDNIATIWPAAGLLLSVILLTQSSLRPWLVGFLFAADFIARILAGISWPVGLIYALALTGDAALSAWLLVHFLGEPITFGRIRELVVWLLLSVLVSNILASLLAATATRFLPGSSFWNSFKWWMAADGIGNLVVTPLVLSWAAWGRTRLGIWKLKRMLEGAVLLTLLAILNAFVFNLISEYGLLSLLLLYLTFPGMLWAAFRFGVRGVASASFAVAVVAIYFFTAGRIAFLNQGSPLVSMMVVQLYLVFMAVPALILAAVLTQRRQFEEALKTSEEKFRHIFDYSTIGKSITLPSGEIHVNKMFGEMIGYSVDELQKKKWQELTHPDDIELNQRELNVLLSGEKDAVRFTKRFLKKDGSIIWADVNTSLQRDGVGKPVYFITSVLDITERKRAEATLRVSQERYRLISTVTSDYMFSSQLDASGKLVLNWVAGAFEVITGYTYEEYVAHGGWRAALHPDDLAVDDRDIKKLRTNQPVITELRTITKTGTVVWVRIYAHPVFDAERNELLGIYGAVQDITRRKQVENTLRENENRFRTLFEHAAIGVALTETRTGRYIDVNQKYCKFLGYTKVELLNSTYQAVSHPDHSLENLDNNKNLLAGKIREYSLQKRYIRKNGDIVWGELTVSPLWGPGEQPSEYLHIAVVQDITERKLVEAKVSEQLEELRQWHGVTLGREMRVLELKEEVNEVLVQAGLPPRYANMEEGGAHE